MKKPQQNTRAGAASGETGEAHSQTTGAASGAAAPDSNALPTQPEVAGAEDQAPALAETVDLAPPERPWPPSVFAVASLVVTAGKKGRRRAGRAFGPGETVIPLGELKTEEIEALIGDPALTVRVRVPRSPPA